MRRKNKQKNFFGAKMKYLLMLTELLEFNVC